MERTFYEEIKMSNIVPENWNSTYSYFLKYQQLALNTLIEFHRVCEEYNINYQIAYGSLLGAIREGGQIPWDYDVDVFVPFEEKDRLITALKESLSDEYYFYCPEVDSKCRHFVMRVAPKGYKTEALHVDVFYVIGSPDNLKERIRFQKKIKRLCKIRYWKMINAREESEGRFKRYCKIRAYNLLFSIIPLSLISKKYYELCNEFPVSKAKVCITADLFADWYNIPTSLITETRLMTVDYGEVRIPNNYDEMLKIVYGDYMRIPELNNRLEEVIRHCNRFKCFEKLK